MAVSHKHGRDLRRLCWCTGGAGGWGSGGWAATAEPARTGAPAQTAQAAQQQREQVIQPASREAIAKAEAAIRSVVESVDQGEPCWYYVDPQVAHCHRACHVSQKKIFPVIYWRF